MPWPTPEIEAKAFFPARAMWENRSDAIIEVSKSKQQHAHRHQKILASRLMPGGSRTNSALAHHARHSLASDAAFDGTALLVRDQAITTNTGDSRTVKSVVQPVRNRAAPNSPRQSSSAIALLPSRYGHADSNFLAASRASSTWSLPLLRLVTNASNSSSSPALLGGCRQSSTALTLGALSLSRRRT